MLDVTVAWLPRHTRVHGLLIADRRHLDAITLDAVAMASSQASHTMTKSVHLLKGYGLTFYNSVYIKQRKTKSWHQIPQFSAAAFLGGLFFTTERG